MRRASDSIWSEQENRAKTSTRNSGAQAAGRLPWNRLRRGATSRKASANMDLMSSQRQEQPEGDESDLARLPLFPIEDHLVQLLRAGRIKSLGKRPSERRHQELSAADWMGLEIAELVGLSVAKSEATCLFVRLSQPDVLREFPALPIELKLPSTERPDLTTVLHNEIEAKGATLTPAEAEKIARKAGVTEGRKKTREALKASGGSSTTRTTKKSR